MLTRPGPVHALLARLDPDEHAQHAMIDHADEIDRSSGSSAPHEQRRSVLDALASFLGVAPSVQRRILELRDGVSAHLVCSNPSLTDELQNHVLARGSLDQRLTLAENPSLLAPLQRSMLVGPAQLQLRLARNPCLAPDVQRALSFHPSMLVRHELSLNQQLHLEDLSVAFLLEHHHAWLVTRLGRPDPSTLEVLGPSWEGTLDELRAALESFSPEVARSSAS